MKVIEDENQNAFIILFNNLTVCYPNCKSKPLQFSLQRVTTSFAIYTQDKCLFWASRAKIFAFASDKEVCTICDVCTATIF